MDNYLTVRRNHNGSIAIGYEGLLGSKESGYKYGYIPEKIFYFYSKRNALKQFREDYGLKGRHCTMIEL